MANLFSGPRRPGLTRRLLAAAAVVAAVLALGACSSLGSGDPGSDPGNAGPASAAPVSGNSGAGDTGDDGSGGSGTTVSGYVTLADGEPVAGEVVEFDSPLEFNFHTTTDANGFYSMTLTDGPYTAEVPDVNADVSVVGRPSNTITVPPSTTVNFVYVPTPLS
jgi:carboxypeptidase family protein